jgi:glycosyltransferase involved in cell wall biosynthesis
VVVDSLAHAVPWYSPYLTSAASIALFVHRHSRTLPFQVSPLQAKALSRIEKTYPRIYRGTPFVTISDSSQRDLIDLGIQRDQVKVIPPGVDRRLFHLRRRSEFPSMVHFSGIRAYKRPELTLEVLGRLLQNGTQVKLFVIGGGVELDDLRKRARPLGSAVRFLGRLAYEQVAEVVGRSWVHLQCSVAEGWGLTAIESAACGTPSVAFRVPGLEDSVSHGVSGFLVPDGNIEAMVDATRRILERPDDMRVSCADFASQFSWERAVDAWEETIVQVAAPWVHSVG